MDVAALETALPALTIAAVTTTPQGLTRNEQVYVARQPRRDGKTDPEAWWHPVGAVPDPPALGASRSARTYALRIEGSNPTLAELQRWAEQVQAHLNGYRLPAVTKLIWTEVTDSVFDVHQREGEAKSLELTVIFHGED